MSEIIRRDGETSHVEVDEENKSNGGVKFETASQELKYLQYDLMKDKSKILAGLLTVAVLILTATFQAGINPPRGLWQQDDIAHNITAGTSILHTKAPYQFYMFLFSNTAGFSCSFAIIEYHTRGWPLQWEIFTCLFVTGFTYGLSISSIAASDHDFRFTSLFFYIAIFLPYLYQLLRGRQTVIQKIKHLFSH